MAERLREILRKFSLSQTGLAEIIGMKQSIISDWMAEKKGMPQSTAMAFQAALGIRWQWLLNGEGEMLLDDMGKLSPDEVRLVTLFRQCDMPARKDILEQAEFQLGRAMRRADNREQK